MTSPPNEVASPLQALTPNGVLVVDKPVGPTSHDIVAQARRYFRTKRVGHAGTLDPMASGVLLVLLGEGTKLSQALTLERKSYEATISFGTSTDTDDALGKVTKSIELSQEFPDPERLVAALEVERARISQLPPIVTAIKKDGMAAHERHRKGLTVEVEPRSVSVFDLKILGRAAREVTLSLTVSKGYYVRSLARDLGESLGVPSHLSALRRTSSGHFSLSEAVSWPLAQPPSLLTLETTLLRVVPCLTLTAEGTERARVGKVLSAEHVAARINAPGTTASQPNDLPRELSAWFSHEGLLVALGQFDDHGEGRVARGFVGSPS